MSIGTSLILLSFALSFTLSISGWFEQFSSPTVFGFGAILSAGGFVTLHWVSRRFREYTRAQQLKRLTQIQVLRFFGTLALFKARQGILPPLFAIPTALMDIAVAASCFWVAARLVSPKGDPRPGFFAWHISGLAALGISVILAILTYFPEFGLIKDGITSQPMTWFPMSIVPTFIGPLTVICHLLAIVSARHRRISGKSER